MAVLVDNFQRTITAVEVKPHKKHSGLQFKTVFDDVSAANVAPHCMPDAIAASHWPWFPGT